MKIAIVHDWFNDVGGAEKVVREMIVCYPDADVFSLIDFYDNESRSNYLLNKKVKTTFLQFIPFARKFYRFFFPFFPYAIQSLNLDKYDLILSSSSSIAKGIRKNNKQLHICYCHSPARYAWDLKEEYLKEIKSSFGRQIFNYCLNRFKKWDLKSNSNVDFFIANSINVQQRIKHNYKLDSIVIYPPVDVKAFSINTEKQNYYFTVSRLVSYKKTELIIKAFSNLPELILLVAGDGPINKKLKKLAPANVKMLGRISNTELKEKISGAKAFVANANEDFGITIVEAQASGTPIVVPFIGGYKETVNEKTGLFFKTQSVFDLQNAIEYFEKSNKVYNSNDFIENSLRFDKTQFHKSYTDFVNEKYSNFMLTNE